jgi:hypothetical protein
MTDQPIAWGMPRPDGTVIDCITPEERDRMPGNYTVPLYAAPQPKAEPVAWQWLNTANFRKKLPADANKAEWVPLYAHPYDQQALELCEECGWKTLIPDEGCLNCERQPKAEQRPPNCGTGFCSCIECPYVQPKAEQERQ